MKVVLDTNVVVSAMLSHRGMCRRILDKVIQGNLTLCVSGAILAEYENVLSREKLGIDKMDWQAVLDFIRLAAEQVTPAQLPHNLPDPSDGVFLETAHASDAILITGNIRHFPADSRFGGKVLSPREFLQQWHG